jgi:type I restriction enzyme R subunit
MPISERATRKERIDSMLASAGWKVVPFDPQTPLAGLKHCAIEEYPTSKGPADYALCDGRHIIAIVEAKKLSLGPQNVLSQAERYAKALLQTGFYFGAFGVPFAPGSSPISTPPPRWLNSWIGTGTARSIS